MKHVQMISLWIVLLVGLSVELISQNSKEDSLSAVWQNAEKSDSIRMEALGKLIFIYIHTNPDTSIQLGKEMLATGRRKKDSRTMVRALYRLGLAYQKKDMLDSAKKYFKKSMQVSLGLVDCTFLSTAYDAYAGLLIFQGKYDSAIYFNKQAAAIDKALNDLQSLSDSYNNIGVAYHYKGDVRGAIKYYTKSMKLEEALGREEGVATSKLNIGILYNRIGDLEKASELLAEASDYYQNRDTLDYKAIAALKAVASTESDRGNYDVALHLFSRVLSRFQYLDQKKDIASSLMNRGEVYKRMERFAEAINDFEKAVQINEERGSTASAMTLSNLAEAYYRVGRISDAIVTDKLVVERLEGSESMEGVLTLKVTYRTLYKAYKAQGQPAKALQMLEKHIAHRDSIANEESRRAMMQQELNYKYEKEALADSLKLVAQNEAQLATQKLNYEKQQNRTIFGGGLILLGLLFGGGLYRNNQRKKAQQLKAEQAMLELEGARSEMKALRSQMNPHFIFNALRSIQAYIIKEKPEQANDYLLTFSKLMRNVLESSQHDAVPIMEDMETLSLYMDLESIRLKHSFSYKIIFDPTVDPESDCVPPLILQPFVENAIWHGVRPLNRSGQIRINLRKENEILHCSVEDDGIGLEASKNSGLMDSLKKESLGLKITEQRLQVIQRRLHVPCTYHIEEVANEEGEILGTRVELQIPAMA